MKERLIYGLLAAGGFILFLTIGSYWFLLFILLMAVIGFVEFARLHGSHGFTSVNTIGILAVILLVVPWLLIEQIEVHFPFEQTVWVYMFLLLSVTVLSKNRLHISKVAPLFIGALYIAAGFHYMVVIRWEHGLLWSLLIFGSIWMSDTGAYLSGRWFGKHLMWPSISPKKTWEGAVGGVVFSLVTAALFSIFSSDAITMDKALWVGFISAVAGQLGDLIQSAYKRHAGVKDSGNLLPGHGGVLDRCDSWIIVFPIVAYFIGG